MSFQPQTSSLHLTTDAAAERMRLYREGLSDEEIGQAQGVTRFAVRMWRKRLNLPVNPDRRWLSAAHDAARMLLYQMGYSDRRISREQHIERNAIRQWRLRRKLPAVGVVGANWKRSELTRDTTLERIKRAIGQRLPKDIADDAVGELYLAMIEGRVNLDQVEREAKRFGNRVIGQFASKFGPRSLDEELGDGGDGFRMVDLIRDDRSSAWLEAMGATVF